MQLVESNDDVLYQKAKPLSLKGLDLEKFNAETLQPMFELMRKKCGIGLAAPQVGISRRFFVMNYAGVREAFINPVIVKAPGKIVTSIGEGCLSYPRLKVDRKRHKRVIVEFIDAKGNFRKLDLRGLSAFCVQHEIDHLDGITIGG